MEEIRQLWREQCGLALSPMSNQQGALPGGMCRNRAKVWRVFSKYTVFLCKNLIRIILSKLKSLRLTKFDGTSEDIVDSSPPAVYVLFVIYSILTVQKVYAGEKKRQAVRFCRISVRCIINSNKQLLINSMLNLDMCSSTITLNAGIVPECRSHSSTPSPEYRPACSPTSIIRAADEATN